MISPASTLQPVFIEIVLTVNGGGMAKQEVGGL